MQTQILIIGLIIFVLSLWAELAIFTTEFGWKNKNFFASASILLGAASVGLFLSSAFSAASVLFTLIFMYNLVNNARLIESRMHESYLRNVCERTFYWLASGQLFCIVSWLIFYILPPVFSGRLVMVLVSLSFAAGGLFVEYTTLKNIKNTESNEPEHLMPSTLPTVTLAIAARNENLFLQDCLQAAIASDYQKLEILVLDDCSQDHTADIIKSFAHDGVRFVQGENLKRLWLPKNLAYQTLLDEAAGEIIIYLGVDVILEPNSITTIVELFLEKRVQMMGIMPKRSKGGFIASLVQPMRYWWELALPKWIIKHEPVLSSCWVAKRNSLIKKGAFASVMRAIVPEEYLSTAFAIEPGGYSFVRASANLALTTNKSLKSQWNTALRIRYPQAHRRPEYVFFRVIIMLYFLIAPFVVLPLLIFSGFSVVSLLACTVAAVCLIASNVLVTRVTNPATTAFSFISLPVVVLIDFIALNISMYRYEFGEVIWKGRDVTAPVMHVIPHLPELE